MIDPETGIDPVATASTGRGKRRRKSLWIALAMLTLVAGLVALIPLTPGYDPLGQNLMIALEPPFNDAGHLLGTDPLGRDLLSRLCVAARVSILIAGCAVAISAILGLLVGLLAGWRGGLADRMMTAIGNIQLSIPIILLLIILIASFGANALLLALLLGCSNWVGYGRVARAQAMALKQREFITSAIAAGGSDWWILRRHLAPNVLPAILVLAAFDLGLVITIESSLSFIGLGVQPPTPSLGLMIGEGQRYLQSDASLTLLPALVIFFLIGGVQLASHSLAQKPSRPS